MSSSSSDDDFYDAKSDISEEFEQPPQPSVRQQPQPSKQPTPAAFTISTAIRGDSDDAEGIIAAISRHQSETDVIHLHGARSRAVSAARVLHTSAAGARQARNERMAGDAFDEPKFAASSPQPRELAQTAEASMHALSAPTPVAPPRRRRTKNGDADDKSAVDHVFAEENSLPPEAGVATAYSSLASSRHESPTRRGSRKLPTDEEVLQTTTIKCLDTGVAIPLSEAERAGILNPLSIQIMARNEAHEDRQSTSTVVAASKRRFMNFFDKSVRGKDKKKLEENRNIEQATAAVIDDSVKITSSSKDTPAAVKRLQVVQELEPEAMDDDVLPGPVWTMKFTNCGRLLATAGQDQVVRVWVRKDSHDAFKKMRQDYTSKITRSRAGSQEDIFLPVPFNEYRGHTADVLDLSWSHTGNYFLLSSSMDKTVRLWHISRDECLLCFMHEDFVTAIAFHPKSVHAHSEARSAWSISLSNCSFPHSLPLPNKPSCIHT
jgi:hypothetical protein